MAYCSEGGTKLAENFIFCPGCGSKALTPERFIQVQGTSIDNTIKTTIGFGLFREIGEQ